MIATATATATAPGQARSQRTAEGRSGQVMDDLQEEERRNAPHHLGGGETHRIFSIMSFWMAPLLLCSSSVS
jgi:ABC-type glutathione transport system ATPase component